jgi:hypothetical protein
MSEPTKEDHYGSDRETTFRYKKVMTSENKKDFTTWTFSVTSEIWNGQAKKDTTSVLLIMLTKTFNYKKKNGHA